MLDKVDNSTLVLEFVSLVGAFILDGDLYACVQEGKFPKPLGKNLKRKIRGLKDAVVRKKCYLRAPLACFTRYLQTFDRISRR